jgi:hypothetical protein
MQLAQEMIPSTTSDQQQLQQQHHHPLPSEEDDTPDEWLCPITQQLFRDPVMDCMGHTFERKAILAWLVLGAKNGTCPLTRRPMKVSDLIPNIMMQTKIRTWQRETGQDVASVPSSSDDDDVRSDFVAYCNFGGDDVDDPTEEESVSSGNDDGEEEEIEELVRSLTQWVLFQQVEQREMRRNHRQERRGRQQQADTPQTATVGATSSNNQRRRFRLFRRGNSAS